MNFSDFTKFYPRNYRKLQLLPQKLDIFLQYSHSHIINPLKGPKGDWIIEKLTDIPIYTLLCDREGVYKAVNFPSHKRICLEVGKILNLVTSWRPSSTSGFVVSTELTLCMCWVYWYSVYLGRLWHWGNSAPVTWCGESSN